MGATPPSGQHSFFNDLNEPRLAPTTSLASLSVVLGFLSSPIFFGLGWEQGGFIWIWWGGSAPGGWLSLEPLEVRRRAG